jgi:hypothetical protein
MDTVPFLIHSLDSPGQPLLMATDGGKMMGHMGEYWKMMGT